MNQRHFGGKLSSSLYYAVPGPDLEIRGRGSSRPLDGGGGVVSQKFFLALQVSVWSKNKGGGQGPSPGSATATNFKQECGSGGSKFSNVWQKKLTV